MKRTLISVFIVLLFTAFFVLIFRFTSGASDVKLNDISSEEIIENIEEPTVEHESEDTKEAEKKAKREETKIYIKEKIVPVVVGVLTSASALIATLGAIKRGLSSIGETKEAFKKESKSRDEQFKKESEYLTKKVEEVEKALALVPSLEEKVKLLESNTQNLILECRDLGKMISLGFSQDENVISSGNGQKISRLLEECERRAKTENPQ